MLEQAFLGGGGGATCSHDLYEFLIINKIASSGRVDYCRALALTDYFSAVNQILYDQRCVYKQMQLMAYAFVGIRRGSLLVVHSVESLRYEKLTQSTWP